MKKLFLFILILPAIFLVCGCVSAPPKTEIPISNTQHTIYAVYRNWHTSIIVDAKMLALHSPRLATYVRGNDFARIGWGDGDYFTGKNKSWGSATKALVASGYSALQVLTYSKDSLKDIPSETIVPLAITDEGLRRLIQYINASVVVDKQGKPITLPAVTTDDSDVGLFLQATDHYSMFNNCNTWSAKALQLAELPLASRLTAQGVFKQALEISQVQAEAGLFKALGKR